MRNDENETKPRRSFRKRKTPSDPDFYQGEVALKKISRVAGRGTPERKRSKGNAYSLRFFDAKPAMQDSGLIDSPVRKINKAGKRTITTPSKVRVPADQKSSPYRVIDTSDNQLKHRVIKIEYSADSGGHWQRAACFYEDEKTAEDRYHRDEKAVVKTIDAKALATLQSYNGSSTRIQKMVGPVKLTSHITKKSRRPNYERDSLNPSYAGVPARDLLNHQVRQTLSDHTNGAVLAGQLQLLTRHPKAKVEYNHMLAHALGAAAIMRPQTEGDFSLRREAFPDVDGELLTRKTIGRLNSFPGTAACNSANLAAELAALECIRRVPHLKIQSKVKLHKKTGIATEQITEYRCEKKIIRVTVYPLNPVAPSRATAEAVKEFFKKIFLAEMRAPTGNQENNSPTPTAQQFKPRAVKQLSFFSPRLSDLMPGAENASPGATLDDTMKFS